MAPLQTSMPFLVTVERKCTLAALRAPLPLPPVIHAEYALLALLRL